jgi:hypothetical protein
MNGFVVAILQISNCERRVSPLLDLVSNPQGAQQNVIENDGTGMNHFESRRERQIFWKISREMLKQSSVLHFFVAFLRNSIFHFSLWFIMFRRSHSVRMLCTMTYITGTWYSTSYAHALLERLTRALVHVWTRADALGPGQRSESKLLPLFSQHCVYPPKWMSRCSPSAKRDYSISHDGLVPLVCIQFVSPSQDHTG